NGGHLVYDGDVRALAERIAPYKLVRIDLARPLSNTDLLPYGELRRAEGQSAELLVPREQTSAIAARMLAELPVTDLTIEEPAIEEVIGRVFAGDVTTNGTTEAA